jgi:hypothetical protein
MKLLNDLIRGHLAPLFAGAIAVLYLVLVGFRGVARSSVDWLEGSRKLAIDVADSPSILFDLSAQSTSLIELYGAFVYLLTPAGYSEWAIFGFCVLAGAVSTSLIFYLGSRLAGALGGWMALFFLITSAPWIGLFTRLDPTFLLIPIILAALCIWYAPGPAWWKKSLASAPLFAIGTLLWSGTLIVLGLVLVVELLVPLTRQETDLKGLVDGPTLEIDRLTTPVLVFLLLLLYPLFWPAPVESLVEFVLADLAVPAPEIVFRGSLYPPDRPPWYFGMAWIFEQMPLAVVIGFLAGIFWVFTGVETEKKRFALSCTVISLALLALPVIFRSPRPLGADVTVLFVAFATPIAALVVCRFFTHALGQGAPSTKVRQVAIVAFILGGVSVLIEAPRAMESPETFRSPMTARMVGWSAGNDTPLREEILPLRMIEISGAGKGALLYRGDWGSYLDIYERMGLLGEIRTTDDRGSAYAAIRQAPAVFADPHHAYVGSYVPALEDSKTTLIPDIHRPLYFLDRTASLKERHDEED